jgi:hypothetical protein
MIAQQWFGRGDEAQRTAEASITARRKVQMRMTARCLGSEDVNPFPILDIHGHTAASGCRDSRARSGRRFSQVGVMRLGVPVVIEKADKTLSQSLQKACDIVLVLVL